MQMAVDIGNTRVKTGIFNDDELISTSISDEEPVYAIKNCFEDNPGINSIVLSSVRKSLDPDLIPIPETIHHLILDHETPLPIINLYGSLETLGRDRIALAVASSFLFPNQNCLIIDIGTCLTMDIVTEKGEFIGGSISPGIQLRLNAMHEGTANLPLVKMPFSAPDQIGKSTIECLKSGAMNGLKNEINGTISAMEREFRSLKVLLTGGDSKIFDNELKSGIFADPNLVLRGLNKILQYNINKH